MQSRNAAVKIVKIGGGFFGACFVHFFLDFFAAVTISDPGSDVGAVNGAVVTIEIVTKVLDAATNVVVQLMK